MSFEPIDWQDFDDIGKASQAPLASLRKMSVELANRRTTKRVRAVLDVTFHGDYVGVEEIPDRLDAWIDAGLNDRDDCRTWSLSVTAVIVESGDPDGYDR